MNAFSSRSNHSVAECFPEKSGWCQNQQVCQTVKCNALDQYNGLDIVLCKSVVLVSGLDVFLNNNYLLLIDRCYVTFG